MAKETMYAVQSNVIRGLSSQDYELLKDVCKISNNLYNVALYSVRRHFFDEGEYLRYESNYYACKENENYKMLQTGVAQQTLKIVDYSFRSFFTLNEKCRKCEYRYENVHVPHYREKGGYFALVCSGNAISVRNGYFCVPMNRAFKDAHGSHRILVKFPDRLVGKKLNNPDQKRKISLGRRNNQNFVQIPFGKLRNQLECLCDRYGIEYVDVEKSYTSKCNFLGGDFLPEYKQCRKYDESRFTGKRKKCGLYVTDDGQEINADVNGAFNIIRKCKQGFSKDELCRGGVLGPPPANKGRVMIRLRRNPRSFSSEVVQPI